MTRKLEEPPEIEDWERSAARCVIALAIVALIPIAMGLLRGSLVMVWPMLWGVWRIVRRRSYMRAPFVFAFGTLIAVVAAYALLSDPKSSSSVINIVLLVALLIFLSSVVVLLLWWALRSAPKVEAPVTMSEGGCLWLVVPPMIVIWLVLLTSIAIFERTPGGLNPDANGAAGLLVLSCVGIWKLLRLWPELRPSLVVAFGTLAVLVTTQVLIDRMDRHRIASALPSFVRMIVEIALVLAAMAAIVLLFRWALRPAPERDDAATTPEPPPGNEPQ